MTGAFTRDKKAQEEMIGKQDGRWSEWQELCGESEKGDGATAECFKGMIKQISHRFINLFNLQGMKITLCTAFKCKYLMRSYAEIANLASKRLCVHS